MLSLFLVLLLALISRILSPPHTELVKVKSTYGGEKYVDNTRCGSSHTNSYSFQWSYTFVETDHEIISTFILLLSAESFKDGLLSVTKESMCMKYW